MTTECWWRNPHNYAKELVECGVSNVAWDRGALIKRNIDPALFMDRFFRKFPNYRSLLIGQQGTAELDQEFRDLKNPKAMYPTWVYGLNIQRDLEEWVSDNVDPDQEHRVVIVQPPNSKTQEGQAFVRYVTELQRDYPSTIIHLHGYKNMFSKIFGGGIGSADFNPRITAAYGDVVLGSGHQVAYDSVEFYYPDWLKVSNMSQKMLSVPRNRCMFNIKSHLWAAVNWDAGSTDKKQWEPPNRPKDFWEGFTFEKKVKIVANAKPGDMIECSTCSLQSRCKLFREGSLCTVPESTGASIAKRFKSRNVDDALDGLGKILELTADRTVRAVDAEDASEIDGQVTKMLDSLWRQGSEYTKLLQPKGPLVAINNTQVVGAAAASLTGTSDQHQLVAAAMAKLEQAGWPRNEITEEQVKGVMETHIVPSYQMSIPVALEEADVIKES